MGTRSEESKFGQIAVVGWPGLVRRVKNYGILDHTVFPGVPYLICSIQEFCGCFLLTPCRFSIQSINDAHARSLSSLAPPFTKRAMAFYVQW